MDARVEAMIKLGLCVAAIVVLAVRHLRSKGLDPERTGRLLAVTAIVAALAYANFGLFNGWPPLHTRELFHYYLGSKYFPELRHDGLYVASIQAERESDPKPYMQSHVRDVRTNRIVRRATLNDHIHEVRARFGPARWQQFVADHSYFLTPQLPWFRVDHGYNPSPTWTFVGRLFSAGSTAGTSTFLMLSSLDLLLLAAMFFGIFRVYGGRIGCLALIVFGLGAPWRYDWMGGAFLRADWIAALGLGICCLKRERFALAGGLIGYAAMIRVFPGAFLIGPAVVALRQLTEGRRPRWFFRLGAGVAAAVVISLLLGSMAGMGFAAWPEFVHNVEVHRGTVTANDVGLETALLVDQAVALRRGLGQDMLAGITEWGPRLLEVAERRGALILAASLAFVLFTATAMWGRAVDEAAVLGIAVVFGAVSPGSYYWSILVLIPLAGGGWLPAAALLAISASVFAFRLGATPVYEIIYGTVSWALLGLFIVWLGPTALRSAREIAATVRARLTGAAVERR
jgi:hypothetical protein